MKIKKTDLRENSLIMRGHGHITQFKQDYEYPEGGAGVILWGSILTHVGYVHYSQNTLYGEAPKCHMDVVMDGIKYDTVIQDVKDITNRDNLSMYCQKFLQEIGVTWSSESIIGVDNQNVIEKLMKDGIIYPRYVDEEVHRNLNVPIGEVLWFVSFPAGDELIGDEGFTWNDLCDRWRKQNGY